MGETPEPGVEIGQILAEKYRVDAILGQGGMGVVARCTHLGLEEQVAIKMLRPDVLDDYDAVTRFIREAQAASKLKSEYVARVTDVGTFDTGVPYMIMEYLEGHDLGELIDERGAFPLQWSIELVLQACEALAEAHSLGIVHRDVKPTNLFVTWRPDGSALLKVLDFGISKAPFGTDMNLTQTQSLLGTPAYMSPEQMRSARQVDTRTDIWSLGTVLYELLEGRRPFEAETFSEMVVKVSVDQPAPMEKTPPQLQPVLMKCLSKTPEQRYQTMGELGHDLAPFAPDVHSANLLAERMARVHRRSLGDMVAVKSTTLDSKPPVDELVTNKRPRDPGPQKSIPTLKPRRRRRLGYLILAGLLAGTSMITMYFATRDRTPVATVIDPVDPPAIKMKVEMPPPPAKPIDTTPPVQDKLVESTPTPVKIDVAPRSRTVKKQQVEATAPVVTPDRPKGECNPFGGPHVDEACKKD
jgi:eukaryotic-like serine/threonine-protein kinase